MPNDRPAWDDKRAHDMIGARVLVGMTYTSARGDRLEQVYGTVVSAHPRDGFEIRLEGKREGEIFRLPPHLSAFQKAPAGAYRLKATGEVVVDPDYTVSWTVNGAAEGSA